MMQRLALSTLIVFLIGSTVAAAPAPAPDLLGVSSCLINPKRIVQLGSPVAGLLSEVLVDRGATITAGQVVAKLESSVEEAQLDALDDVARDGAVRRLGREARELARRIRQERGL